MRGTRSGYGEPSGVQDPREKGRIFYRGGGDLERIVSVTE